MFSSDYRLPASCFLFLLSVFAFFPNGVEAFTLTVDNAGDVGYDTSLAVVNGYPAISYFDDSNGNLKYIRAANRFGAVWYPPVVVDANPGAGMYTSMAIVNGNPAISYYYDTGLTGILMYVRANDRDGTTWAPPVVVDNSTPDVGWDTSLAVVAGYPAISYFDDVNGQLRYIRALDVNGGTWGAPVVVDANPGAGMFTTMAVVNGNPAISYYYDNSPLGEVRYIRANSMDGSTWGTPPVTLDTFTMSILGGVPYLASFPLAVINGNPAVSFMNWDSAVATYQLNFIRAVDANGAAWGAAVVADNALAAGTYSSLKSVDGAPAIAYFEANNEILKYIRADSSDGSTWGNPPVVLDAAAGSGDFCSMALVNGNPAVSYYDSANGDLKYCYFGTDVIPTLSQWGAILFSTMLMITAVIAIRKGQNGIRIVPRIKNGDQPPV